MIFAGFLLCLFGISVIIWPDLISYLVGGLFLAIGMNLLLFGYAVKQDRETIKKWFYWIKK